MKARYKAIGIGLLGVVVLAVVAVAVRSWSENREEGLAQAEVTSAGEETPVWRHTLRRASAERRSGYVPRSAKKAVRGKKPTIAHSDDEPELTAAEEKLLATIAEALEREDLGQLRELCDTARKADKVEIRRALVDALGWFGSEALPELTALLADPDEDVVFEATAQWQSALYDLEEDRDKAPAVEKALMTVTNPETLEEVARELHGMDELLALRVIVRVIGEGTAERVKAAQNAYELVTGDTWTGIDAAEAWLQENYAPPDPHL